jgi:multidrug efflux pump subunit AcrA (membrane-fusion protein)
VREESRGSATRYSATVEPEAQVAAAFRVSGYVDAITVEEGDRIAKGTVLARIRTADYEQKPGQATASQAAPTDEETTRGLRRPQPRLH